MSTDPAVRTAPVRTAPESTEGMPSGIPFIVGNEAAERFSFYGMKAILVVFMTKHLLDAEGNPAYFSETAAKEVYHYFTASAYFFPLLGALLADWLLGKYRVIIWLSVLYCVGHGVLALMDIPALTGVPPKYALFAGLALIAVGSGGIKPCVSAHVGDQFGRRNAHLLERVFGWFYFSINLGAFVSMLLTPYLLEHYGPAWAFGTPGLLMTLATYVFWLGRHRYAHIPPGGDAFVREIKAANTWQAIGRVVPILLLITPFWMLFDQTGSAWVLQLTKMNGSMPGGWELLPSQVQAANSIMVLTFIPLFSLLLYPFASRFTTVTPLRKIGVGLFLAAVAFGAVAIIEQWIAAAPEGDAPHRLWQLIPFAIITAAEILVSITSLEFIYSQAPRNLKSVLMGLYFLSISLANVVVGLVNKLIGAVQSQPGREDFLEGASYYVFFAGVAVASGVLFVLWSRTYQYHTILQDDADAEVVADAVNE